MSESFPSERLLAVKGKDVLNMCLITFCTQAATIDLKLITVASSWLNFGKPRLSQKCTEEIRMEEKTQRRNTVVKRNTGGIKVRGKARMISM